MNAHAEKTVVITGANAGIGKEVARQLALRREFGRIYLACRNAERAETAKAELEAATGRRIFSVVLMDVADLRSVRAGLAGVDPVIGDVPALGEHNRKILRELGYSAEATDELIAAGVTTA